LVEVRGIEPLSEDSNPWISPSADSDLNFPPPAARCQAAGLGSFILPGSPQSLGGPVPHIIDAGGSSRERLGPTFRGLRPRKLNSDCCQLFIFPVVARYRGRGSLSMCPTIPVETSAPPGGGLAGAQPCPGSVRRPKPRRLLMSLRAGYPAHCYYTTTEKPGQ